MKGDDGRARAAGAGAPRAGPGLTRRQVLRGSAGVLGLAAVSALAAACGAEPDDELGLDRLDNQRGGDGTTRTISFLSIQPHERAARQLAGDFKIATGTDVRVTIVPYDQIRAKAIVDVQSGAAEYDVFDYWYTTVGELAHQDVLEDLTDFIEQSQDIDAADFIASIYDPYTLVDGRRWGLPFDGDSHVLFYNRELLWAAGFDGPPRTWDAYVRMAARITDDHPEGGVHGAVLPAQAAPIIIGSAFANRLAGFGGRFLDNGKPALDERAVAAAASMLAVARYTPDPAKIAFDAALELFLSGKVAMMEFWTDLGVYAEDPRQSKVAGKWGVAPLPVGGANSKPVAALNAGFALGVSRASGEKELAKQFVKFATSKQVNLELITTGGSGIDPTRRSTLTAPQYSRFAPQVQKAARLALNGNGAISWPTSDKSPELMEKLSDQLSLMLQGRKRPETAVSDAQAAWEQVLSGTS
jgi:multiple sugar transport system substrate-binding protein